MKAKEVDGAQLSEDPFGADSPRRRGNAGRSRRGGAGLPPGEDGGRRKETIARRAAGSRGAGGGEVVLDGTLSGTGGRKSDAGCSGRRGRPGGNFRAGGSQRANLND